MTGLAVALAAVRRHIPALRPPAATVATEHAVAGP